MFNFYVVSYDLHLNKDYVKVKEAINQLSADWIKPLESFYIIKTSLDAAEVREALMSSTDNDDSIFVVKADLNEWSSYGVKKELTDKIKQWI
ncbi:SinR-like protein [Psychrobacter sp. PAMC 21119]|uniref:SinR-like protein n=1 Tax=Psychrobacter sp. PAMC 21119 TaxID=1112209 RepID=UPI000288A9F9|nr:SinR-like protein [Psychrobacter sp. PAMC 21119]